MSKGDAPSAANYPRYTSSSLFHFVGRRDPNNDEANLTLLIRVLSSGWISHPPHEPGWGVERIEIDLNGSLADNELVIPSMTCFCDIPAASLGLHMSKYGRCGIAIRREQLVQYGARPVLYFPVDRSDHLSAYGKARIDQLEHVLRQLRRFTNGDFNAYQHGDQADDVIEAAAWAEDALQLDVLCFAKAFDPTLDERDPDNYYMEREWRRLGNMRCDHNVDVSNVVVPRAFVSRILDEFPDLDGKILCAEDIEVIQPAESSQRATPPSDPD